jgi:hypothetical protein
VKLPPAALTAPSLCPRCDAPAIISDYCIQCTLPLRKCGSCQGVAGPFDRFCGFCGYELVQGDRRAPIWRLWLLAALVPLAAGLAIGLSPLSQPFVQKVETIVGAATPPPNSTTTLRSASLKFTYAIPKDWTAVDASLAPATGAQLPFVVASHSATDQSRVMDARGDLLQTKPDGAVVELGRPPVGVTAVDASNPTAVLAFQLSQLIQAPPAGVQLQVMQAAHAVSVDGRPGAAAVLRLTRDGQSYDFERVWIAAPGGLFRVDALALETDWVAGDQQRVDQVIRSLRFSA